MSTPMDLLAEKTGFPVHYNYDEMPTAKKGVRAGSKLLPNFVAHATTEKNLPDILTEGLQPRSVCLNEVWSDQDVMPEWVGSHKLTEAEKTKIQNCRQEHTYFYDDTAEVLSQALGTVAHVGYGDPAVLILQIEQAKLKKDPEITNDRGAARALMQKGTVDPKQIACFCTMLPDEKPDTGIFLCPTDSRGDKKRCYLNLENLEDVYEKLQNPDAWACHCRRGVVPSQYSI